MDLSKILDQTADRLETIDWKQIAIKIIEIWDRFFKVLVILMVLTYLGGKSLGTWVHNTNDFLARHWVQLIVPQIPLMEKEEEEDEAPLPTAPSPTPLVVANPWEAPIEVELILPLKAMAIPFTMPLMLAAAQAPVALLAAGQELIQEPPPAATNGRRRRVKSQPTEATTTTPRPRGRRAHANRK